MITNKLVISVLPTGEGGAGSGGGGSSTITTHPNGHTTVSTAQANITSTSATNTTTSTGGGGNVTKAGSTHSSPIKCDVKVIRNNNLATSINTLNCINSNPNTNVTGPTDRPPNSTSAGTTSSPSANGLTAKPPLPFILKPHANEIYHSNVSNNEKQQLSTGPVSQQHSVSCDQLSSQSKSLFKTPVTAYSLGGTTGSAADIVIGSNQQANLENNKQVVSSSERSHSIPATGPIPIILTRTAWADPADTGSRGTNDEGGEEGGAEQAGCSRCWKSRTSSLRLCRVAAGLCPRLSLTNRPSSGTQAINSISNSTSSPPPAAPPLASALPAAASTSSTASCVLAARTERAYQALSLVLLGSLILLICIFTFHLVGDQEREQELDLMKREFGAGSENRPYVLGGGGFRGRSNNNLIYGSQFDNSFNTIPESNVCTSEDCVRAAARILDRMDPGADPCQDFYQFSCGRYGKTQTIPEDHYSRNLLQELQDENFIEMRLLLEEGGKQWKGEYTRQIRDHRKLSATNKLKLFYDSCMNETASESEEESVRVVNNLYRRTGASGWPLLKPPPPPPTPAPAQPSPALEDSNSGTSSSNNDQKQFGSNGKSRSRKSAKKPKLKAKHRVRAKLRGGGQKDKLDLELKLAHLFLYQVQPFFHIYIAPGDGTNPNVQHTNYTLQLYPGTTVLEREYFLHQVAVETEANNNNANNDNNSSRNKRRAKQQRDNTAKTFPSASSSSSFKRRKIPGFSSQLPPLPPASHSNFHQLRSLLTEGGMGMRGISFDPSKSPLDHYAELQWAVIHIFARFLPPEPTERDKRLGRIAAIRRKSGKLRLGISLNETYIRQAIRRMIAFEADLAQITKEPDPNAPDPTTTTSTTTSETTPTTTPSSTTPTTPKTLPTSKATPTTTGTSTSTSSSTASTTSEITSSTNGNIPASDIKPEVTSEKTPVNSAEDYSFVNYTGDYNYEEGGGAGSEEEENANDSTTEYYGSSEDDYVSDEVERESEAGEEMNNQGVGGQPDSEPAISPNAQDETRSDRLLVRTRALDKIKEDKSKVHDGKKEKTKSAPDHSSQAAEQSAAEEKVTLSLMQLETRYPKIRWRRLIRLIITQAGLNSPSQGLTKGARSPGGLLFEKRIMHGRKITLVGGAATYLDRLMGLLSRWSADDVDNYMYWSLVARFLPYLGPTFRKAFMDFRLAVPDLATAGAVGADGSPTGDTEPTVGGQRVFLSRWKECVNMAGEGMDVAASLLYLDAKEPYLEKAVERARDLLNTMKHTFAKRIIGSQEWMVMAGDPLGTEWVRDKCRARVNNITDRLAFPAILKDERKAIESLYTGLEIRADKSYQANIVSIARHEVVNDLKKLAIQIVPSTTGAAAHTDSRGTRGASGSASTDSGSSSSNGGKWIGIHPDRDWIIQPLVVNAFYESISNKIILPPGILRFPLISFNRPKYLEFATLGVVLGHEIGHAFDSYSRDSSGQLAAVSSKANKESATSPAPSAGSSLDMNIMGGHWWPPEVAARHQKEANCFARQFAKYHLSSISENLNGNVSMEENICDFAGLQQAYVAYQDYIVKTLRERDKEAKRMKSMAAEKQSPFKLHNAFAISGTDPEPNLPGLERWTQEQLFFIQFAQVWCEISSQEGDEKSLLDAHSPGRFRANGALENAPQFARAFGCKVGTPMNPPDKCKLWLADVPPEG